MSSQSVSADAEVTPTIPVLRGGTPYESLDTVSIMCHRTGRVLCEVGQANAGIIRRDLRKIGDRAAALRALSCADLLDICARAGEHFMQDTLPLDENGATQSPQDYVEALSASSGLPHRLCRRNMEKLNTVFTDMPKILDGLMRGLDLSVIDRGFVEHNGAPLSYARAADALGIVLPSNSPGVNSIWMPSIPLKVPVIIKPGREEPWTPMRLIQAFIAAGCPREAFGFYPTDHEGAGVILEHCPRALLFGDARVTKAYESNPGVQIHGPGRSKIIIGEDEIDRWQDHLDVLVSSTLDNGGRSCINVSCIIVPSKADEVAEALARALAAVEPGGAADPETSLSAWANPRVAELIDGVIDDALGGGGAEDVTARHREGSRRVESEHGVFMRPTVVRCRAHDHALANTEYMFPFVSVVEMPTAEALDWMGPSLVVTAITRDEALRQRVIESPLIDRLNLGPVPTTRVDWDQPHEGNLFEFLFTRRAVHRSEDW